MTHIEASKLIDEDQFIRQVAQEILVGNTRRLTLLKNTFGSPIFKKRLQTDKALKLVIAKICADSEIRAKAGNSHAMVLQAFLYYFGIGYPLDYQKAIHLYEQAIQLGESHALFSRARMHQLGEGGLKNYPEAIRLYEQAIQSGHKGAMCNRAFMHEHGQGGPVNYPEAIRLYEQALQLGNSDAMNNLALMHQKGEGGPKNYPEAIRLYEQAIQLGNSYAMTNRAFMHQQGQGGPIDYLEAIRLYECAVRQGNSFALQKLDLLAYFRPINDHSAKQLLAVVWTDLIKGQSFSTTTLLAFSQYCKAEIINRLKEEPLSTSLTFLKQLKTNPNHPLAFILNNGQPVQAQPTEEFKGLMAQAKTVLNTRITFFNQGTKQENNSPFNCLPLELKVMLFSFVQPNLESDRQENFFCLN